LLGITPSRGSQSKQLLHEADTVAEWHRATFESFLRIIDLPSVLGPEQVPHVAAAHAPPGTVDVAVVADVAECARKYVGSLSAEQRAELMLHCATNDTIPGAFDRSLLSLAGKIFSRWLDETEKRLLRASVIELIRKPPA
jgi:hypothetical protein